MGTLAGSTIMLLTIAWASCLWVGRCDLNENGEAIDRTLNGAKMPNIPSLAEEQEAMEKIPEGVDKEDAKKALEKHSYCNQLNHTGVTHRKNVLTVKLFMLITSLVFFAGQIPEWLYGAGSDNTRLGCLVGAVSCFALLLVYLVANIVLLDTSEDKTEAKAQARVEQRLAQYRELNNKVQTATIEMVDPLTGKANLESINEIFRLFDVDGNGVLEDKEMEKFMDVVCLPLHERQQDGEEKKLYKRVRTSLEDAQKMSQEKARSMSMEESDLHLEIASSVFVNEVAKLLEAEWQENAADNEEEAPSEFTIFTALVTIVVGTVLITIFSDGVVSSIDSFGEATGIPTFIIGFVVCPFASNASELISSLQFASRKKKTNTSITYSQIYAACTMNNTMCLGVFYLLVYIRGLRWDFAAEVIGIVLSTFAVGASTCSGVTYKTWMAIPVILVYPLSLILVEILRHTIEKT